MTKNIAENIHHIKQRILNTAKKCHRDPNQITLLAVSKTKSAQQINEAIQTGQYQFGENYVKEGIEKIHYFREHLQNMSLIWHFIGPLQSNKTRLVAENFDWIHTLDRFKIAERLSGQRPKALSPLNGLIQINISHETTKSGIHPEALFDLAEKINALPNLTLRGIMAIPAAGMNEKVQKQEYNEMFSLYSQLKQQYPQVDTLSLGMSNDMEVAIAAGSTLIRIGIAIFGTRNQRE